MLIESELVQKEMQTREKLFGKLITRFDKKESPKPFTTLIEIIKSQDIDPVKMRIMAYSIESVYEYYQNQKELFEELQIPQIDIYAYGVKEEQIEYDGGVVRFIPLKGKHTEHFSFIYDKNGDLFLYYEPYHKGKDDFYIDFENGDDNKRALYSPELRQPNPEQAQSIESIYTF